MPPPRRSTGPRPRRDPLPLAEKLIASFREIPLDSLEAPVGEPVDMADAVSKFLHKYKIGQDTAEQRLRDNWAGIAGPANAHYSHPLSIDKRDRLLVLCSHAIVRNELFLHQNALLAKIRAVSGCQHIKSLHFSNH